LWSTFKQKHKIHLLDGTPANSHPRFSANRAPLSGG